MSEHIAAARLLGLGFDVFWPAMEGQRYDLLVLNAEGTAQKVQVKTAYWQKQNEREHLVVRTNAGKLNGRRPYMPGDWDLLVAVHPESGRVWLFPRAELPSRVPVLDLRGDYHPSGRGKRQRKYDLSRWEIRPEAPRKGPQ